jgi:superfamily II DNA or RNA helicase
MAAPAGKPRLRVLISRRTAAIECEPDEQGRLRDLFSFRHPNADFIPKVRSGEWDGFINLLRWGKVSAGLFYAYRKEVEDMFRVELKSLDKPPAFRPPDKDSPLRPYQRRGVDCMINASDVGGIILSATGSGKTFLAGDYFKRLIGTGVFIVDELTLLDQAQRELSKAIGEEVGIVGNSKFNPRRITVATVQTLHRHRTKPPFRLWFSKVDVLIIDELHVQLNRRNIDVITKIRPKAVFGLTATLQLKKDHVRLPAIAMAGPVIFEYPIQEGVKEGYLTEGRIFIVPFHDPLRGMAPGYWGKGCRGARVRIPAGSPMAEYRRHICLNKARNDLVEELTRKSLKEGRKVFVLVERVKHLRILAKRMSDLPHYALSGQVSKDKRLEAMQEMDAGRLNLILASRVFAKGVDVRSVDCIIDATGMPSRNNVLQRYGRGVRKTDGKNELLFYDIADRGNSKFTDAAWARFRALHETGAPITQLNTTPSKS